jgi:hypothetical protein
MNKTCARYVEQQIQIWLHHSYPDVALHLCHRSQKFAGNGELAAVGVTVIMKGAEGVIVRVPPPEQRRWDKGCRPR